MVSLPLREIASAEILSLQLPLSPSEPESVENSVPVLKLRCEAAKGILVLTLQSGRWVDEIFHRSVRGSLAVRHHTARPAYFLAQATTVLVQSTAAGRGQRASSSPLADLGESSIPMLQSRTLPS